LVTLTLTQVVKIHGFSMEGRPTGQFSGFIHGSVIVAAGHMLGFGEPPAMSFKVTYPTDGFQEAVQVVAQPMPGNVPDLMLLRGTRTGMAFQPAGLAPMSTVYAFGYTGNESTPSCSKGSVANTTPGAVAITAHADNGFSGGPVVDMHGRLMGVVQGSLGSTIMRVGVTPSYDLHTYLLQSRQPGLI
jgi:hypothetical protein